MLACLTRLVEELCRAHKEEKGPSWLKRAGLTVAVQLPWMGAQREAEAPVRELEEELRSEDGHCPQLRLHWGCR